MQSVGCVIALSLLLVYIPCNYGVQEEPTSIYCDYKSSSSAADSLGYQVGMPASGQIQPDGKSIKCNPEMHMSCFAFWIEDNNTTVAIIKGCWIDSSVRNCPKAPCQAKERKDNAIFCCCYEDWCNRNLSEYIPPELPSVNISAPGTHYIKDSNYKKDTIIIALVPLSIIMLVIIVAFAVFRLRMNPHALNRPHDHLVEAPLPSTFDLSTLKLSDTIKKGRYSEVIRGTLNDEEIVVKKFAPEHRQYYYNERNIYSLPFMDHESFLKFYNYDEQIGENGLKQYLVVMSYIPLGSLKGYLKNNTINWSTFCKMSYSIAKGVAHLHMELKHGNLVKPVIAHRDLNTNNILVRSDLSCVLIDFGFSQITTGFHNNTGGNSGQATLTDVGTISYMAPEVLEGAVNLRDCVASLKEVDIYALGLVLWEVASRCSDLYQGLPVPEHMIPFQAEVGPHPTIEEMQMIVYHNKLRPQFPDVWKDSNQAIRALKETIEDCWDSDAEARLTALCVEERLLEMAQLWAHNIRHKGVSPTLNTTFQDCLGDKPESISLNMANLHTTSLSDEELSPSEPTENSSAPLLGRNEVAQERQTNPRKSWNHDHSISSSTTETLLLSSSESEPTPVLPKPRLLNLNKSNLASQPQQGRNPIVERNTHKSSDEELTVSGNTLVSSKTSKTNKIEMVTTQNPTINVLDSSTDNPETPLVQNDHLSPHRNRPIAYQQNPVHSEPITQPPNNPNNQVNNSKTNNNEHKHRSLFSKLKPREIGYKLSHLTFGKNKSGSGNQNNPKTPNKRCKPPVNLTTVQVPDSQDPRHTEVRMLNGMPVVRPTSLPMSNGTLESKDNHLLAEHRLGLAEVGVAKLQTTNTIQPYLVQLRKTRTHSVSDLSASEDSSNQSLDEMLSGQVSKRPSALPVHSHSISSLTNVSESNLLPQRNRLQDITPREKIKRRIKTPVGPSRARFSLCNDRMMSSQSCDDIGFQNRGSKLHKASISLHQLGSVDREKNVQALADV